MPTTFANTIDGNDILAKRSQCDYAGNDIQQTYATKSEVTTGLASKQDTISDLATIRSGAQAGATAVQPGDLATVATTGAYSDLSGTPTIPTATSDLTNDSGFITLSDVPAQVNADWNSSAGASEILNKPTIPSGTQLVPAATSADEDKVLTVDGQGIPGWAVIPAQSTGLFQAEYGTTTYADIVQAIRDKKIVYCRLNSGASRMAFLAYVGSSNVEFQYYRSLSSHSASNMTDEVYVYTVASSGWTTTTRKTGVKVMAGTHMSQSYSNDTLTLNADWPTVDQTYDGTSTNAQSGTAVAGAIATKEDAFDVGTGLEMDTSGSTPTLQVEAPVDIVAGPGIVIDNPDGNTMRVSQAYPTDETVLYEAPTDAGTILQLDQYVTLSESMTHFERVRIYYAVQKIWTGKGVFESYMVDGDLKVNLHDVWYREQSGFNVWYETFTYNKYTDSDLRFTQAGGVQRAILNTTWNTTSGLTTVVYKIVGVHRLVANN